MLLLGSGGSDVLCECARVVLCCEGRGGSAILLLLAVMVMGVYLSLVIGTSKYFFCL